MSEQIPLLEGDEATRVALAQYDTPPALAARQVAMIGDASWLERMLDERPRRVLEPSAGNGALVRALLARYPDATVDAVELDPARAATLRAFAKERTDAGRRGIRVHEADFLEWKHAGGLFDLGISNPPFSRGMELRHIAKTLDLCTRSILQLPIRALHGQGRMREVWGPRLGKTHWIRHELRIEERAYPNASDDIIIIDVRREEGPARLSWWCPP